MSQGPRLTEVLVAMGCDSTAIRKAAAEFYREGRFGEFLVKRGVVSQRRLDQALARQEIAKAHARTLAKLDEFSTAGSALAETVKHP